MQRLDQCLRTDTGLAGSDWQDWLRVYLAGGSASEWAGNRPNDAAQDLDVLIGVDYAKARSHSPALSSMDDGQVDTALNAAFRSAFNETGWHPQFGGTWSLTAYANPHAWDICSIKPYAAYDVSGMTWSVKPPHLPEHALADFNPATLAHARAVLAEARAVLKMPEPLRTREARALWQHLHEHRCQAFSQAGEGWTDPGNVDEKMLAYAPGNVLGRIRDLALAKTAAHRRGAPLYHGSLHEFPRGTVLTPAGKDSGGSRFSGDYVYASTTPEAARYFGSMHDTTPLSNADVYVHRVEPVGDVEPDDFPAEDERYAGGNYRAKALRVLDSRKVPGHWASKTAAADSRRYMSAEELGRMKSQYILGGRELTLDEAYRNPEVRFSPRADRMARNSGYRDARERHDALRRSIREHGIANSIFYDPDTLEVGAGHHRYFAGRDECLTEFPVNDHGRKERYRTVEGFDEPRMSGDGQFDVPQRKTAVRQGDHLAESWSELPWGDEGWAAARREPWHAAAQLAQEQTRWDHPRLTMQFPRSHEGGDEMVGHILRYVGYKGDTDGAFVSRHPRPENRTSNPAWLNGKPGVALHPDKWDYGTVTHEAAHHAVTYDHAAAPNEYQPDEQSHGPEWAGHYALGLNKISPGAGDDFLGHHQRYYAMITDGLQWKRPSDLDAADERARKIIREGSAEPGEPESQRTWADDARDQVSAIATAKGHVLDWVPATRIQRTWPEGTREIANLTARCKNCSPPKSGYELTLPVTGAEGEPENLQWDKRMIPAYLTRKCRRTHEPVTRGPASKYDWTRKRREAVKGYEGLTARTGMIYLDIPEGLINRVRGGVDDKQHITLVYLGKNVSDKAFEDACRRAKEAAARCCPLEGVLCGVDTFDPSDPSDGKIPAFVPAYIPGIGALRSMLEDLSASEHRHYRPHVTLGYYGEDEELPSPHPPVNVRFARLFVKRGDQVVSFPLGTQSE